jgi:glutathione synthase/RimK-type ligase-like ATP-grasp enzyme
LIVELIKRGLPYFRLNGEDLAHANYHFALDECGSKAEITIGNRTLTLNDVTAVWYRRAIHPIPTDNLSSGERQFVAGEIRHLATALVLNPGVLWVNPIDRVTIAEHKLYQLQIAQKIGFNVPRTLVTRDASKLKQFAEKNTTGTICKPIFHGLFSDGSFRYSVYTRRVRPETFDNAAANVCPVLVQEEVPRIADVRATFIGTAMFAVDISADQQLVDWRESKSSIRYSITGIGDTMEQRCRMMLNELGLVYGAFDFIRKPNGELVFLEINPTGEWAWLEDRMGFPMRSAFIKLFFESSE